MGEYEARQIRSFTLWCRKQLGKANVEIEDITKDFSDGVKLIQLAEVLIGEKYPGRYNKNPKMIMQKIDNCNLAINWIVEKLKVKFVAIDGSDIANCERVPTLGLIWTLINKMEITDIKYDGMTGNDGLLKWCQESTEGYEGAEVNNFTTSWKSGLAFCALINKNRPDKLDYQTIPKNDPKTAINSAFKACNDIGIYQFIEEEDLLVDRPDSKIVMMQLSEIMHTFTDDRKDGDADNQSVSNNANTNQNPEPKSEQPKSSEQKPSNNANTPTGNAQSKSTPESNSPNTTQAHKANDTMSKPSSSSNTVPNTNSSQPTPNNNNESPSKTQDPENVKPVPDAEETLPRQVEEPKYIAKKIVIGIDLGVDTVRFVMFKENNIVNCLKQNFIPSAGALNGTQVATGNRGDPKDASYSIDWMLRYIGKNKDDQDIAFTLDHVPYTIIEDASTKSISYKIDLGDGFITYSSIQILNSIFKRIKTLAVHYAKQDVSDCIVCVPAIYSTQNRDIIIQSAKSVGLNIIEFIEQANAAVLYHIYKNEGHIDNSNILVFDVGMGKTELSIVGVNNNVINVANSVGSTTLGGLDITLMMIDQIDEEIVKKNGKSIKKDPHAVKQLYYECELAKQELENKSEYQLNLNVAKSGIKYSTVITQQQYYQIVEKFSLSITRYFQQIFSGSYRKNDINEVIVIGETAKIKIIYNIITQNFPNKKITAYDSSEACSIGSAYKAGIANQQFTLHQVTKISTTTSTKVYKAQNTSKAPTELHSFQSAPQSSDAQTVQVVYQSSNAPGDQYYDRQNQMIQQFVSQSSSSSTGDGGTVTREVKYMKVQKITVTQNGDEIVEVRTEVDPNTVEFTSADQIPEGAIVQESMITDPAEAKRNLENLITIVESKSHEASVKSKLGNRIQDLNNAIEKFRKWVSQNPNASAETYNSMCCVAEKEFSEFIQLY